MNEGLRTLLSLAWRADNHEIIEEEVESLLGPKAKDVLQEALRRDCLAYAGILSWSSFRPMKRADQKMYRLTRRGALALFSGKLSRWPLSRRIN